jgi:hypothetical protein
VLVKRLAQLGVITAIVCGNAVARADTASLDEFAFELDTHLGWIEGQHSGGPAFALTPRVRYFPFTLGASAQGATVLIDSMGSLSAVGGLCLPLGPLRWDALAELGYNGYEDVGSGLLSDDPGASAVVPFAGARIGLLAPLPASRDGISAWIGISIHYAEDLRSETRTYTYINSPWFSLWADPDQEITRTVRMGQSRLSMLVAVTVALQP